MRPEACGREAWKESRGLAVGGNSGWCCSLECRNWVELGHSSVLLMRSSGDGVRRQEGGGIRGGREWEVSVRVQMRFEGAGHRRGMFGIKVVVISQLQILGTSCGLTELLDDATYRLGVMTHRLRT